jgi:hypothetical protein
MDWRKLSVTIFENVFTYFQLLQKLLSVQNFCLMALLRGDDFLFKIGHVGYQYREFNAYS